MTSGTVPAPRGHGWWRVVAALAAFVLLPHVPGLPSVLPVVDTLVLLVPALAACCVVGWLEGGSLMLALLWSALAAWIFMLPTPPGDGAAYYDLARGWGLIMAGAFGVMCLTGRGRPFLPRALSALGLALLLSLVLIASGRLEPSGAQRVFTAEFDARNSAATMAMQESARIIGERLPSTAAVASEIVTQRIQLQQLLSRGAAPLFPAILALEGLMACALAWSVYHRISRVRIGETLAPLKRFAFGDQLVWALVVGITLLLLPTLSPLGTVGLNLLLFFGALYVLRGYGIFAWFVSRRVAVTSIGLAIVTFPLSLATLPAALGLGLSDTWLDWRSRVVLPPPPPGAGRRPKS
jgi:hypothetical protein